MGSSERELIFCETFNHEGSEELHVDLIRFTVPVVLKEVRIVPKDRRTHANINELDRIGQTTPFSFNLDVYCNDSTNPLAPTFDHLTTLEFQEEAESSNVRTKTASDLVVVRGHYTVLTLCLYGNVAPPPSIPSPFRSPSPLSSGSRSGSPYSDSGSGSGYSDDGGSPPRHEGGASSDRAGDGRGDGDDRGGSKRMDSYDDLFEPFSPVNSPDGLFDLSDEELGTTKRSTTTPGGYVIEEFSDEEISFNDDDFDVQDSGIDSYLYSEDAWIAGSISFNPYQCDLQKLKIEFYPSQTESPHEALMAKLQKSDITKPSAIKRTVADEASKLREVVFKSKDAIGSQKWIETMEEIPSFLYPGLAQLQKKASSEGKEAMQKLVTWTMECLSLQRAQQTPIGLNIRLLKAGMRMVPSFAALGRKCAHMLVKFGVMEELVGLVSAEDMASSMKLLAVRAIDSLLDYPQGVESFLGWSTKSSVEKETPYQLMLKVVLGRPTVRVSVAVSALLQKAHIYELVANLQLAVDKVVACTPVKLASSLPDDFYNITGGDEDEGPGGGASGTEDDDFGFGEAVPLRKPSVKEMMDVEHSQDDVKIKKGAEQMGDPMEGVESQEVAPPTQPVPPEVMASIVLCLEELRKCLEKAPHAIVQPPLKSFPTPLKCFPETKVDYLAALVRMLKTRRLLECLLVLLTAPSTALDLSVFGGVRDLLFYFLSSQQGLLFLAGNPPVVNAIARTLTQDNELPVSALQPLAEFLAGDSDSCTAQNLGLLIIYHLQILQSLDDLRKAPRTTMVELESAECLGALHTLYSMTLAPIGRSAVAYVLSLEDNVTTLLPFVEPKGQKAHDNKLSKWSVSSRYAAVIILQLLQSPVRGEFLFPYGQRLLTVANFFKENPSLTMSDLYNWLYPVKELPDTTKTIPALVSLIKETIPRMSCHNPGKANAPILTSLRLLHSLITPLDSIKAGGEPDKDLKRKHSIISLFSAGAMDVLVTLLQQLADVVLPVWCQRQPVSVSHANIIVLLASFALKVARTLLTELLADGTHLYRDTRIVSALLSFHKVLCSAPHCGTISNSAPELQTLVVDILVVFTKPEIALQDSSEEKSGIDASGSPWCLMLQDLFKHTLASPNCFLSGLMLLSELLPLPLPVQLHVQQPSTAADSSTIVCLRRLWAVHLEPFMAEVEELLCTLVGSSCTMLQCALRRVCAQLADLSHPLATLFAREVIRTIICEIEKQLEQPDDDTQKDSEGEGEKKSKNSGLLRMLTTCAVLCQQPAFKTAVLDLLQQKETMETKSFSRFIPLLLFLVQKKETIVPTKLCVMTILNALCNVYVSMCSSDIDPSKLTEQQLSDCLPGQSQLEHITSAVLGHVTSSDQALATVALGLKVIHSLCQYSAGLAHLYGLFPSNTSGFSQLLSRLIESVKSSSPPSPDTLTCISLFLEILQLLHTASFRSKVEPQARRTHSELHRLYFPRTLLKGFVVMVAKDTGAGTGQGIESVGGGEVEDMMEADSRDLLLQLKEAVEQSCKEDESLLEDFFTPITELLESFQDIKPVVPELPTLEHSMWPDMHSVVEQFETRDSIVTSDTNDTSNLEYWLASTPHDENDLAPDTSSVDLLTLASKSCSGLNIADELKKQLLPATPSTPPKNERKRKMAFHGPEAQKRLKEAMEQRLAMGRGKDIFRMRKQNTSRPPSMHVDDFMAFRNIPGMPKSGMGRGGRGSPMAMPYLPPHPGGPFMQHLGGRWGMGGVAPNLGPYPRRDIATAGLGSVRSWESRFPHAHAHTLLAHMKQPPPLRSLWPSQLPSAYPYSRARERGLPWLGGSSRLPPTSAPRLGESWKGRHSVYNKRLV